MLAVWNLRYERILPNLLTHFGLLFFMKKINRRLPAFLLTSHFYYLLFFAEYSDSRAASTLNDSPLQICWWSSWASFSLTFMSRSVFPPPSVWPKSNSPSTKFPISSNDTSFFKWSLGFGFCAAPFEYDGFKNSFDSSPFGPVIVGRNFASYCKQDLMVSITAWLWYSG